MHYALNVALTPNP